MFARVRWHLVGWNLLVLVLILTLVGGAVYVSLARSLTAEVDRALMHRSEEVFGGLRGRGVPPEVEGYHGGDFALVLGADGAVLINPQRVDPTALRLPALTDPTPRFINTTLTGSGNVRLYLRPLAVRGAPDGTLIVGESLTMTQQTLGRLVVVLLVSGGTALLLVLGGAWFLAGRALVPIQQSFRRQQEFVADAAHELRTPLTVLRSATDLLAQHLNEPLAANQSLLEDARGEILWMQRLADELLTLARGDGQALDLAVGEVDLPLLVADVVRRAGPLARQHAVALTFESDAPSLPLEADPDRLEQVLRILLDNAFRHTPAGGNVAVQLARQGHTATLAVRDTGEGIAPEHLPRLFDRFYRADPTRSRASGNTGLGLAIAQTLVHAHGGTIHLTSVPGAGTVATVRLPLTEIPAPAAASPVAEVAPHISSG